MVKSFGRWTAWGLGILGSVTSVTVLECLLIADWRHHFFSLLSRAVDYFLPTVGTSGIGFHAYWIIPLLVVVIGVILVRVEKGRKAMLTHWEEARLAARVIFIALALYFVPIFCWSFVKSVYADHAALAGENSQLKRKNVVLSDDIEDRKNNFGPASGPVYDHVRTLLYAFMAFRRNTIGETSAPCHIKITAPRNSGPIVMTVSEFATIASGCGAYGPMDSQMNPDVEEETRKGMIPGVVIIHTSRDLKGSLALYSQLSNVLPLQRSYEMPKDGPNTSPNTLIWLQFGGVIGLTNPTPIHCTINYAFLSMPTKCKVGCSCRATRNRNAWC